MLFDRFRPSSNIEDRRDGGGGGMGGGRGRIGIIGIIIALVISYFTGISPQTLLGIAENFSGGGDRKSTRLNSSHIQKSRMPSSA